MPDAPTSTTSASEALSRAMSAAYGDGAIPPEALPTKESRESDEPTPPAATGATAAPEPATGATAAPEPATGATAAPEPSPTGATAAPEPSPTGATAAPEPSPTGATAEAEPKLTDDQLDAAQKKMTVAAGTAFKHVRNENADLKAETAKLRAELDAAAKGPPVTDAELEKLRTENAEFKERLAAVDYQNSEEFAANIAQPLAAVDATIQALATKYNVDAGALRSALAEPDTNKRSDALSELSTNFNRIDMQRFDSSILDYDKLNAEKQRVLQTAFQRQEEERRNAQAARIQSAREIEANWKNSLTNSLNKLTAESPIFAKTEDEAWDKQMGERIAKVQAVDLGKVSPEAVARAFYKSEALDLALGLVTDLVNKNSEQDAMITKLRGGTPKAGGGTPPAAPVGPTGPTGGASFIQVARERLGSILPP